MEPEPGYTLSSGADLVPELMPIRMVSFNIRYAVKIPSAGEEPWPVRCPKICAQLGFVTWGHSSSFVCLQEALYTQLTDILSHLGPRWGYIGQGRDDGKESGEFTPILFRTDTWRCERSKTFWLSQTPEVPSRGWDACLNRVVTMGSFRRNGTGTRVLVMSTHLDHRGERAREESAKLLLKLARSWCDGEGQQNLQPSVFLGGDFNCTREDKAYKEITRPETGMRDILELVPRTNRYGNNEITYTAFGGGEEQVMIDYLFVLEPRDIKFASFGILSNRFDDEIYLSDHRAIVADMEIPARAAK